LPVRESNLERAVDGLGSRVGEEDPIDVAGQELGERRGELELEWMAHLKAGRVIHACRLRGNRTDDRLAAVAGVHTPQTSRPIEHATPIDGGVVHPLRLDE